MIDVTPFDPIATKARIDYICQKWFAISWIDRWLLQLKELERE